MTDPYRNTAELYEAEYGSLTSDIAYFARVGTAGRLLVLGCGTGRVSRGLGGTRPIVGLDRSAAMIAKARELDPLGEYSVGDMGDFDLGTFAEVIIPNASFNFLTTRHASALAPARFGRAESFPSTCRCPVGRCSARHFLPRHRPGRG
jgi:SAM-dependent methyltransferase